MKKISLIFVTSLMFVLAGCQNPLVNEPTKTPDTTVPATTENVNVPTNTEPTEQPEATTPTTVKDTSDTGKPVGIANPASQNCISKGGTLEMRNNKNGQYGVCLFEDNRQCEEWALMRGDCPEGGLKITGYDNDAEIYCAITGGQVEGVGTETPMCKRIDGTLCTAQANLDGDCPDPNNPTPNAGNTEAQ